MLYELICCLFMVNVIKISPRIDDTKAMCSLLMYTIGCVYC